MVQTYPILAFPFAALFSRFRIWNIISKIALILFIVFTAYFSLWFTHQAHRGGLLMAGEMTKAYFWKSLGKYERNEEYFKLLDTDEIYEGERSGVITIYADESYKAALNKGKQFSSLTSITDIPDKKWIRTFATFETSSKEWNRWLMTQFIVEFKNDDQVAKRRMIRIQRTLGQNEVKRYFFDVSTPEDDFDRVEILFWNANSQNPISISNLVIEAFDEI